MGIPSLGGHEAASAGRRSSLGKLAVSYWRVPAGLSTVGNGSPPTMHGETGFLHKDYSLERWKPSCQSLGFEKPSSVVSAIADSAVRTRKLLLKTGKQADREAWRVLRDAVRLARAIEAIASRAADLPAEDASAMVELLEVLSSQLGAKADRILTR